MPVKTVSARVGHSTPLVTMSVYAHLLEGDDEAAADSFAATVSEATQVSAEYHGTGQEPNQVAGERR